MARDGTFTLAGQSLTIAGQNGLGGVGRRLEIEERLDGSRWVEIEDTFLPVVAAPERPIVLRQASLAPATASTPSDPVQVWTGDHDPNHPWRRYPAVRPR